MSERATAEKRTESTPDGSPAPAAERSPWDSGHSTRRRPDLSMRHVRGAAAFLRTRVANAVWLVAALCAAVLALGALLVAFQANPDNSVVRWFTDGATWLAGPLSTVFEFTKPNGSPDAAKNALVNWGIAALAFLVVGRLVHRLIRPSS